MDFLDPDRVAEMRAREAEEEALVMEDPSLRVEEEDDGEMDDIFTDFMKKQELEVGFRFRFRWNSTAPYRGTAFVSRKI